MKCSNFSCIGGKPALLECRREWHLMVMGVTSRLILKRCPAFHHPAAQVDHRMEGIGGAGLSDWEELSVQAGFGVEKIEDMVKIEDFIKVVGAPNLGMYWR